MRGSAAGSRGARVGVIGCGWWATEAHLPALAANPDAIIAGIADPDDGNRERAAGEFGIARDSCFRDAVQMLESVQLDGVIVAVPHAQHATVAREVLTRGIPVLLEKPMTIRPADAHELQMLALERGVEILVGYGWHYNTHVKALRAAISSGAIGRVEFVTCQYASVVRQLYSGDRGSYPESLRASVNMPGERTYSDPAVSGGGQGQTQTTHLAALLFWLTRLRPVAVAAMVESFELAVDLVDAVTIRFDNGAVGSIATTGSQLPGAEETLSYRIYGTDGRIDLDVHEGSASIHRAGAAIETLVPVPVGLRYPQRAPADNLVEVILGQAANGSPGDVGVLAVEFVDAMYRASKEGRTVQLGPGT